MSRCIGKYNSGRFSVTVELELDPAAPDAMTAAALNMATSIAQVAGNLGELVVRGQEEKMPPAKFANEYMKLGATMLKQLVM